MASAGTSEPGPGAAPPDSIGGTESRLRAGALRVGVGLSALILLPLLSPDTVVYRDLALAYLVGACAFQVAIWKNVGGELRVLLGGVLDTGFLTVFVHRMGSSGTPMLAIYPLLAMFNALVARPWTARAVTLVAAAGYAAVVLGEAQGLLPYAPDEPMFASVTPTVDSALRGALTLALVMTAATLASEAIARSLRAHEAGLQQANARLAEQSQRDGLTGLHNRRHFLDRAAAELLRLRRGHPAALLMMDLDGFKRVNDKRGHLAGDDLLRRIARAIEGSTREVDVVGRYGGDEFVALLTDAPLDAAEVVAARLVTAVRAVGLSDDPAQPVTVSVGVAEVRPDDDVTSLIRAADAAAYTAKAAGGDRAVVARLARPAQASVSGEDALESGPRAARQS